MDPDLNAPAAAELAADDLPGGFRYAGVACGIKPSGRRDLSLILADGDVTAAGVYTQNQVVAAPVLLCRERTPSSAIRAVVVNSGNANACTGDSGRRDADQMTHWVARHAGCDRQAVLVMSTGVIGQRLPMAHVENGIQSAASSLGTDVAAFQRSADAILTTDRSRKIGATRVEVAGQEFRIAGMCKGAGMIAPNMATMLATVLTDAPLSPADAQDLLRRIANVSFNRVSVDGHTSTNDSLLLLASGRGEPLAGGALDAFAAALETLCVDLAKQLPADGEGARHVLELTVTGAASGPDAERIAREVAASPLVKTAITGGDPNWGRIVSAAGYAGPPLEIDQLALEILGTPVFASGQPVAFDAKSLSRRMQEADFVPVQLRVGNGPGEAMFWASDLTTDYVDFNSRYTT